MAEQPAVPNDIEAFLKTVEARALRRAEFATGSLDDAFDILQDAMYKLVDRYGQHDPQQWPALFNRILQNRIHDWGRRRKLRRALFWFSEGGDSADPVQQATAAPQQQPEQQQVTGAAMVELDAALRALPERQQQVFLLRAWEGLDTAATAAAMGISAGSVKTHYSRALDKLRQQLGEHWP